MESPSLAQEENAEGYAVSSRGRVRKVKKMVNYDGLDFEKLALQASEEAELERLRKKRKKEEEEKEREEQESKEEQANSQPSGVHRYLLSQAGQVMGYIDNKGHVHSGSGGKVSGGDRGKVDISSVRNLASQLVTGNKKEAATTPTRPGMMIPPKTFQNLSLKPYVPTVAVAAINDQGSPVYVRVVGEQALQLVKLMRPSIKGRVSQIKLQHHGQTYTINTNAHMITHNIPGLHDGEATVKPASSVSTATPTSSTATATARPLTNLQSLATNNSPSVPRVAPISSVMSDVSSSNTLALAYRGVAKQARPTTVSAPVRPQGAAVPRATAQQEVNRLTSVAHTRLVSASPSVVSSVVPPAVRTTASLGSSPTKHTNLISVNQSGNRQSLPTARSQVTPVVNRIGVPTNSTATVMQSEAGSVCQTNNQQQIAAVQSTGAVAVAPAQPLGQTITATPVAVPGPGGQTQVQLKLESESLAQLMQRTGSKIVALPNGRGGYTLSLTPGAVQPGQKNQTQIAANTAAKVQVVSGANALLEDTPQTSVVQQQQPQVVQQQTHVISQGVAQPAGVAQQTSLTQQIGVRQVVPVSQVNVSGSSQVVSRVGVQQRVIGNLVSSPQGARTAQVPVTAVIASHQPGGAIINSSQPTGVLQKVTGTQSQLTGAQTGQHQLVLQQRVAATGTQATVTPQVNQGVVQQAGATYKQVVVNQPMQQVPQQVVQVAPGSVLQQQQVVRLHPVSGSGRNAPTQKLVQIVQPGGARQVVQMVQQVVASQGQANQGHQQLIYVQGNGQVVQQQAKASIGTVHHTLQGTTLPQNQGQQIVGQQALGEQKLQPQIINQQQIVQQQASSQTQQHIVQQKQQVAQTQVVQQQTQQVMQQHLVVQQQQPQQQQQSQQQQVITQQQQQQSVAQQQQTVVQQQPVVQQQQTVVQQQVVQQQGRLVLVRTSQGEQMALQLPDGRVSLLTQEQLQAAINNGSIKVNQQT